MLAAKAWSDAEDKASNSFISNFKAVAAIAITSTHPAAPDAVREQELRQKGWHVASDWYAGIPAAPAR